MELKRNKNNYQKHTLGTYAVTRNKTVNKKKKKTFKKTVPIIIINMFSEANKYIAIYKMRR